jgi:hypothetical protein
MEHCKDCKHWSRFVEEKSFGRCELVNIYEHLSSVDDDEMAAVKLIGEAFIGDSFWTRPEFGCVRFEAKVDG